MSKIGKEKTKAVYEDPAIIQEFINVQSNALKLKPLINDFAKTIQGKKVIDIGCGPGHDAYYFSELGFDVTGIDYSVEMIKQAKLLKQVSNSPTFLVADILDLNQLFQANSFDGAWAAASLFHLTEEELPQALQGIHKIVKNKGKVFVGLKEGTGTHILSEEKYGHPMEREFTLWTSEAVSPIFLEAGFIIEEVTKEITSTTWLRFFLEVKK